MENMEIKILSETTQEILSKPPRWIFKWGIYVFMMILVLSLLLMQFIKYPETINADFILTAENPPKVLVSVLNGRIEKVMVTNNEIMESQQTIAYMESMANPGEVLEIKKGLTTMYDSISLNDTILYKSDFNFDKFNLGELQLAFNEFNMALFDYNNLLDSGYFQQKNNLLFQEMLMIANSNWSLKKQKLLIDRDCELALLDFKKQEKLFNKKVIPPIEFDRERRKYLSTLQNKESFYNQLILNSNNSYLKKRELLETLSIIKKIKHDFSNALKKILNEITVWEKNFIIKSPIKGRFEFIGFLQAGQLLTANQEIGYIQPENNKCFGIATLSTQIGLGKIVRYQKIQIKFDAFPSQEYGFVEGNVLELSNIPDKDGKFQIKVSLPSGLKSNTNKVIPFRNNLKARAEIITEELSLLQRIFYQFRKIFD